MTHKAGFVNIIGNPNVGKSTLMNAFVGERLSIITSKAQTTRHRILGIVNGEDFQMVLSDTPGIIKPAYEMQESMMNFVKSAFEDADILIYMVEIGEQDLKDEDFFNKIIHSKIPVLLLLNKIDNSNQEQLETQVAFWTEKVPNAEIYPISALQNFNVPEVFQRIIELLPESPAYYPKDQLTDKPERFFCKRNHSRENLVELQQRNSLCGRNRNRRILRRRKNYPHSFPDYGGTRHPKRNHHWSQRRRPETSGNGIPCRFGEILRQTNSPRIIRESQQKLEKQRQYVEEIWV